MGRLLPFLALALLAGCGAGGNPAFRSTGEVIAMGGGDGGAAHACIACHGLRGEGDGALAPRLAGLDRGYLHRQLNDYASGRREHAAMRTIVRHMSDEDRGKVSTYYADLPATALTLGATSALYAERCASCHGPSGEGVGPGNPPLAGQSSAYIAAQLHAWRAGKRNGGGMDEMLVISRALTLEQIQALADLAGVAPLPRDPRPVPAASR